MSNRFSAEWLRLREPIDMRSRAAGLRPLIRDALRRDEASGAIQVVDIGAGAGSNLRYAVPLLSGLQNWLLVDHDCLLLEAAVSLTTAWAQSQHARVERNNNQLQVHSAHFDCDVRWQSLDLASELHRLVIPDQALIAGSALLDLVSENWLERLAERASQACAPVWFSLIYDGRIRWHPGEPEDEDVRVLFNQHQQTDKGFGPALGPSAAKKAIGLFSKRYRTLHEFSDWHLGPAEHAAQRLLLDGYFETASEMDAGRSRQLEAWRDRRRTHIDAGRSELTVGHIDIAGLPGQAAPA